MHLITLADNWFILNMRKLWLRSILGTQKLQKASSFFRYGRYIWPFNDGNPSSLCSVIKCNKLSMYLILLLRKENYFTVAIAIKMLLNSEAKPVVE